MLAELDFMIMIDLGQISKWKSKEAFNCSGVQYTQSIEIEESQPF